VSENRVIYFSCDFTFKHHDQAKHFASALIEDGRFDFCWQHELTQTSEQWEVTVSGPWVGNLKWMAEAAMKVDAEGWVDEESGTEDGN
jgi:hypothetical protein